MPRLSSEVQDALYCLSKVCQGSTPDKSIVRDSSRVLPVEIIYSLHTLVSSYLILLLLLLFFLRALTLIVILLL